MEDRKMEKPLNRRIREGDIRKRDVIRRLGELAFGKANDCVRLVLEDRPEVDGLDLSLLCEVRRSDRGMVEVRLLDRLRTLEQLAAVLGEEDTDLDGFLRALQGGEGE